MKKFFKRKLSPKGIPMNERIMLSIKKNHRNELLTKHENVRRLEQRCVGMSWS